MFVLGYLAGSLDAISRLPGCGGFCAGTDLNSFRGFFLQDGQVYAVPLERCKSAIYEGDKFRSLFQDVGIECPLPPLRLIAGNRPVEETASRAGRRPTKILLHPFSAEFFKEWPLDKWLEVVTELHRRGMSIYVSSGISEREVTISSTIGEKCTFAHVLPWLPLFNFLASLKDYDIVLSGDTFITHAVGSTGGTISLAVYGPTDPSDIALRPALTFSFHPSPSSLKRLL